MSGNKVLEKEVYCRVGQDWHTGELFIGEFMSIHRDIAYMACKELGLSQEELHNQTCNAIDMDKWSKTGDHYLARKVLKLKVKVILENCKLEEDVGVKPMERHQEQPEPHKGGPSFGSSNGSRERIE